MGQSSKEIIVFAVVFPAIAIIVVGLRFWCRRKMAQRFEWDDYFVFAAVFMLLGFDAIPMAITAADDNLGNHQKFFQGRPIKDTYRSNICNFIINSLGFLPIAFAKISMLWLYKRIFRGRVFVTASWVMIAVVIIWGLTIFFGNIFQCTPVPRYLHDSSDPNLHCVNFLQMSYAHAISDVCIDFIIMIMPWPTIWNLHMTTQRKVAVTVVFVLGCLTIAASAAKTAEFYIAGNKISSGSMDISYIVAPTVYYTEIEASLGIVTVCIPSLGPLFRGRTAERLIASVRSVWSLHSMPGSGSDIKQSQRSKNRKTPASPSSSVEQLHMQHPMQPIQPMPVYDGRYQHEASVAHSQADAPEETYNGLPKDAIAVKSTWETSSDAV